MIYRVRRCPEIEKEVLFAWFKQLLVQIEQYQRYRNGQCYRYVNPYSVLITKEDQILLLDLEAESNAFVLKNLQKRAMREHFVKPIIHIKENTKLSLDLYGYAKTIQFILAGTKVMPSLSGREEYRLAKLIGKCLNENPKKQYDDLKQVEKALPVMKRERKSNFKRISITVIGCVIFGTAGLFYFNLQHEEKNGQDSQVKTEENQETENQEEQQEKPPDRMDELTEEIHKLEQYLLRNTVKENQEVIRQGEELHREVLRYLAAAYDREGLREEALRSYRELCEAENQDAYLETAYIRRMVLEMEQYPYGKEAVITGKEALERLPLSDEVAKKYVEVVCSCNELSEEEKEAEVERLAERFLSVRESEGYRKWKEEQQTEQSQQEKESGDKDAAEKQNETPKETEKQNE